MDKNQIFYHKGDLPAGVTSHGWLSVDTETMGLCPMRDPLCCVQLMTANKDGTKNEVHIVHFPLSNQNDDKYDAPNLKKLLSRDDLVKIFHFARFDVAVIACYLDIFISNIFCTKIASKLTRTYTDQHGLKNLCSELLGVTLSKEKQTSFWGADELSKEQLHYAANDVIYLPQMMTILSKRLASCDRLEVAKSCFEFLPSRAWLDLEGFEDKDIFAHH